MNWKFWQKPKSDAEISMERLESGTNAPVVPLAGSSTPLAGPVSEAPDGPSGFRMPVEDVFTIARRGTVVTGNVAAGTVRTGQTVTLTSPNRPARRVTVSAIEAFRQVLDSATQGQNVGLLLKGVSKQDVAPGDELAG